MSCVTNNNPCHSRTRVTCKKRKKKSCTVAQPAKRYPGAVSLTGPSDHTADRQEYYILAFMEKKVTGSIIDHCHKTDNATNVSFFNSAHFTEHNRLRIPVSRISENTSSRAGLVADTPIPLESCYLPRSTTGGAGLGGLNTTSTAQVDRRSHYAVCVSFPTAPRGSRLQTKGLICFSWLRLLAAKFYCQS